MKSLNCKQKFRKTNLFTKPGPIIITQESDVQAPPLPPKIIRKRPLLPVKPAPLIYREQPPVPPVSIPSEHHIVPGRILPPPPRQVITEKLPQMPEPPRDIIVERWLEYEQRPRRVMFHPAPPLIPASTKNVLIEWDSPNVIVNRRFNNLGISLVNPNEYKSTFGNTLVDASKLPAFIRQMKPPNGTRFAAENKRLPVRLVGDVSALSLIRSHTAHLATFENKDFC